jgi:hypothetical protein
LTLAAGCLIGLKRIPVVWGVWCVSLVAAPADASDASRHEANQVTVPDDARPTYPSLHMLGFTDLDFFSSDAPGGSNTANSGFFEGQLALHFTAALSPRFTFFGEASLTARRDAATTSSVPGFNPEVERSILKYTQSDFLKLSVGRYHTPVSYWNVAFHHGQWLQTTISRPDMIQFGGQFLPVHFVGALVEGSIPSGAAHLSYNVGVGNGRATVVSRAGDAGDVNNNRAWIVSLSAIPDRPFGLQAGASYYADKITLQASAKREHIWSAYLAWTKETPELIAEYASVGHRDLASGVRAAHRAYYVQVAYRLRAWRGHWKPYYRWEDLRVDARDGVFTSIASRKGSLVGLRFDAADLVALKAEYRRQRDPGSAAVNAFYSQVSFSF